MRERKLDIKFWKEWTEANELDRIELVKKLTLIKSLLNIENKKIREDTFANVINSYFEDLENFLKVNKGARK